MARGLRGLRPRDDQACGAERGGGGGGVGNDFAFLRVEECFRNI